MQLPREVRRTDISSFYQYAQVVVKIPNRRLPRDLQCNDAGTAEHAIIALQVSPFGQLTHKPIYLNSVKLAQAFCDYIDDCFADRPYADCYELEIREITNHWSEEAIRWKNKHSMEILAAIGAVIY